MDVRITTAIESQATVVFVEGWLQMDNVLELHREYQQINGPVVLDLSKLRSADLSGVATLLDIASRGARLQGASGYIHLLLQRGDGVLSETRTDQTATFKVCHDTDPHG